MIAIVDDDEQLLERMRISLELDGHDVRAFGTAAAALEAFSQAEPDLVLTDVMMPAMDGFELKREYERLFPARLTPFVLLTGLSRPEDVVRGLDAGADDYITKPVRDEVLRARVRSCLRRARRYARPEFVGDLARYPMMKVVQFCEQNGLSGTVEFHDGSFRATLTFRGGEVTLDGDEADATLEKLYGLERGTFRIHPQAIRFDALAGAAIQADEPRQPEAPAAPSGCLSAVSAGSKALQVQTEFVASTNEVRTLVTAGGRVVSRRIEEVPAGSSREALQERINRQHAEVESAVEARVAELSQRRPGSSESPAERFERLFWEGLKESREGRLEEALAIWGQAQALSPHDKVLAANLKIVRTKLEAARMDAAGSG